MQPRRFALATFMLLTACGKGTPHSSPDHGATPPDLAAAPRDFAVAAADLAAAPDLGGPADLAVGPDLATPPDLLLPGVFVDPVNGSDGNSGDAQHPLKTVKKASQLVAPNQTIYLLGGTYDGSNQATMTLTFPAGTWLRAVTPGTVTFDYAGGALTFAGGGVENVAIHNFGNAIVVPSGTFATKGVSFSGVSCPVTTPAASTAVVTIDMTGVATPIGTVPDSIQCVFVFADGTSNVTWKGGGTLDRTWAITPAWPAVFARGAATVTIDGVTIDHMSQSAVLLDDNAHGTLRNMTIHDSGSNSGIFAVMLGGQNTQVVTDTGITLDNTSVTASKGAGIVATSYAANAETVAITLTNSHVDGSTGGLGDGIRISSAAPTNAANIVNISLTGSTVSGNNGNGITAPRANVTVTGGAISNNVLAGITLTDSGSANSIKVRGAMFATNGGDALALVGTASASLDLGKTGDAGNVVFSGVSATFAAVRLTAAITGHAVGNTWIASQQGADASGHYVTPTTLAAGASGLNAIVGAGASLVVAE